MGFVSSFIGLLCFALSSSFEYLFGERNFLKMCLYTLLSCIILCFMLYAHKWQHKLPRNLLLNFHLGFLVLLVTSLSSYFNQGKPDLVPDPLSLISSACFSLMSLSLSRQIDLGFEVDLFNLFLGLLIAQCILLRKWLTFIGLPICYFLMLLRSYLDYNSQSHTGTIAVSVTEDEEANATNRVNEGTHNNGYYIIMKEDRVQFASDIEDKLRNKVISGFAGDCCHVFIGWRRQVLDNKLLPIRLQKLNLNEIDKVPLNFLEKKIQRCIMAFNYIVRTLLPDERNLCDRVFSGFPPYGDFCFMEICQRPMSQILDFSDAIAAGNGSPEKLFRILSLFDGMRVILPEINSLFSDRYSGNLRDKANTILEKLREAIKGVFMDLEDLIRRNQEESLVLFNGGIHPLTHYIVNYLAVACKSRRTLERVFRDNSEMECPLSLQVTRIMDLLNKNLEAISEDSVLCSVFMMNNVRYIVQNSRRSEIGKVLGEEWIRQHVVKVREYFVEYKRRSWGHVVEMLEAKEFMLEVERICEEQSKWVVFDEHLREKVRSSLKKTLLLPAHEKFNILSEEDIVAAINKLFKGRDELRNCR